MKLFELLKCYIPVEEIPGFANSQGVAGLLYDEVLQMYEESGVNPLDRRSLMRLAGYTQKRQEIYHSFKESMERLARFYQKHGIGMMVLKGYGLSLDWPVPDHRPSGDLDIWLFDLDSNLSPSSPKIPTWKRADELIEKAGIKVDDSHEHHTCFRVRDISVENHYDIVDVKTHKDGKFVDGKLKALALEHVKTATPVLENVYLPPADFNAIFLMRHMGQDFGSTKIYIRQICDWAFFIEKHGAEVDWKKVIPFLEEMGIIRFFHIINAICVDYLGFDEKIFPVVKRDAKLEKRIIDDLFNPEFTDKQPKGRVVQNIIFKTRRYWKNSWKKQLIFKYSPLVDFYYGCKMHLSRWRTLSE